MLIRFLLLSNLFAIVSLAQISTPVVVRDLETWTSVGLSKKVGKLFTMKLEQGLRLYDNSTATNQVLTNFDITLEPAKFLAFSGGIRYIYNKTNSGDFENNLRYNFDVDVKHKLNKFTFKYRLRAQMKDELGYSKTEGDFLRNGQRLKVGVNYNIKKWKFDPTLSTEIFRESGKYMLASFHKIRFTIDTERKIKKIGELGLFYRIEKELNVAYPKTTHIFGTNFTFKFK